MNPNQGLKVNQIITFSPIEMFFAPLFCVYGDYIKTQNRRPDNMQKLTAKLKTQIKILPFPGLA